MIRTRHAHVALVASVLLFSVGWPFTKAVLAHIDPFSFLAAEVTAAAFVAICVALRFRTTTPTYRQITIFAALGALSPGINYALAVGGLAHTSASAAALISAVDPIATVLLSVAILREHLDLRGYATVLLSCIGLILIVRPFGSDAQVTLGGVAVTAGVLASALYVVLLRFAPDVDLLSAVAAQLTGGALTLVLIAVIANGPKTSTAILSLPPAYLIATIAAGPVLDYLPYLLLTYASRFLSGTTIGMAFNLSPLWAVAVSAIFLSERLAELQVVGGILVIAATIAYHRFQASHSLREAGAARMIVLEANDERANTSASSALEC